MGIFKFFRDWAFVLTVMFSDSTINETNQGAAKTGKTGKDSTDIDWDKN